MSETTTAAETPDPAATEAPNDAAAQATETQPQAAETEGQDAEAEGGEKPRAPEPEGEKPEPRPDPASRRFAQLTARQAAMQRELEEERRARQAAEALLAARAEGGEQPQPTSREEIQREAARLVAQEKQAEQAKKQAARLDEIVTEGRKSDGDAAFDEKSMYLANMGATANPAFMGALVEMPNAHRIVSHLADDPDALAALLAKPPVAMAAEMGRISARMEAPAEAARQPVSNAPRPPAPARSAAVAVEFDPDKATMKQYDEWRKKTAPRALGGRRT